MPERTKGETMKNIISYLTAVALCLMLAGCSSAQEYLSEQMSEVEGPEELSAGETEETARSETEELFFVHVSGAVSKPGVYELPEGSRLFEAVEAAGGFLEEADCGCVNLAEEIRDGEKYHIPTIEETAAGLPEEQGGAYGASGLLNINRAGVEELMQLNGIGKSKAEAIVAYRSEHGDFEDIEELKNVSGIGEKLFAGIKDDISIR